MNFFLALVLNKGHLQNERSHSSLLNFNNMERRIMKTFGFKNIFHGLIGFIFLNSFCIASPLTEEGSCSPLAKQVRQIVNLTNQHYEVFLDIYFYYFKENKSFNMIELIHDLNNINKETLFKKNMGNLGLPEELFFEPLWQCFRQERIINYQKVLSFINDNLPDVIARKEETITLETSPLLGNYFSFLTYDNLYKRK